MRYSRLLGPWFMLWLVMLTPSTAVSTCSRNCTSSRPGLPREEVGDIRRICNSGGSGWQRLVLSHCGRTLASALKAPLSRNFQDCISSLELLRQLDFDAGQASKAFARLLNRYDCSQPYSVKFQCHDCQEAYRSWICSALIGFWSGGRRIKPCRSFCHKVEQQCPFFLPLDKGPAHYAGEPTFLCLDPHIEETEEQRQMSLYGSNSCCYEECESESGLCVRGTCLDQWEAEDGVDKSVTSSAPSPTPHGSPRPHLLLLLTYLTLLSSTYRTKLVWCM